jgi:hypothetical protein
MRSSGRFSQAGAEDGQKTAPILRLSTSVGSSRTALRMWTPIHIEADRLVFGGAKEAKIGDKAKLQQGISHGRPAPSRPPFSILLARPVARFLRHGRREASKRSPFLGACVRYCGLRDGRPPRSAPSFLA